jgi:hypothetical protein
LLRLENRTYFTPIPPGATDALPRSAVRVYARTGWGYGRPAQTAILTNVGTTTLSITNIDVVGTDNGDFSASNTCHGSVGPGGTCSIIVRFIPTEDGLRTAAVDINDNGGGSPQTIKLNGIGT